MKKLAFMTNAKTYGAALERQLIVTDTHSLTLPNTYQARIQGGARSGAHPWD